MNQKHLTTIAVSKAIRDRVNEAAAAHNTTAGGFVETILDLALSDAGLLESLAENGAFPPPRRRGPPRRFHSTGTTEEVDSL